MVVTDLLKNGINLSSNILHFYLEFNGPPKSKEEKFIKIIRKINYQKCIVFVAGKFIQYHLKDSLDYADIGSIILTSDLSYENRIKNLNDFKDGKSK